MRIPVLLNNCPYCNIVERASEEKLDKPEGDAYNLVQNIGVEEG